MNPILEVRNISKSFIGVRALRQIDVKINSGEIHCFAGENGCGKSTLVKCISGVYTPDQGEIIINGTSYSSLSPAEAMEQGIQVIYQDLSLFQHMSAAENIAISTLKFKRRRLIDWEEVHAIAEQQLKRIGVEMDLDTPVGEMSIANRQMVAICRALAQNAKILFMDEPTTALTRTEVQRLMGVMLDLKKKGLAIIFISHKLDEVFAVADTITIFRNGEKIGDFLSSELNEKRLSYYMTGREIEYSHYKKKQKDESTPVLSVRHLTRRGQYENVSFDVQKGDIVGLTGLLGSGRTELAMTLFGMNPAQSGTVSVNGRTVSIKNPMQAKKYGIALLPEDRFTEGLFIERAIRENVSSAIIDQLCRHDILNRKQEAQKAKDCVHEFNVRTPSIETVIGSLSGGNQQKVVIGKWAAMNPSVFIMDTPTVGIDIGSKSEIYNQIHRFAEAGMSILLISDEIQEIMANCNRVIVMSHGKCVRTFDEEDMERSGIDKEISNLISAQTEQRNEGTVHD